MRVASNVVGVHGRRELVDGSITISAGAIPPSAARANVVLVTVRDTQLPAALSELLVAPFDPHAVILQASGGVSPANRSKGPSRAGHPVGTFHPLVPIPHPDHAAALMRGAWNGVDGDPAAIQTARALAAATGANVLTIPSQGRAAYHAAA